MSESTKTAMRPTVRWEPVLFGAVGLGEPRDCRTRVSLGPGLTNLGVELPLPSLQMQVVACDGD
jgi:hypothetical protein